MFNEAQRYSIDTNLFQLPLEIPTEIHQLPYGYASGVLYFQFERKNLNTEISKKDRVLSLIPVAVMFFIIITEVRGYLFWHILPMLESNNALKISYLNSNSWEHWKYFAQLFIFLCLCTNLIISSIFTIYTPPGEVVKDLQLEADNLRDNIFQVMISEKFLEKMKKFGNCERKRTLFPRFCRSCLMVKPDRSHHCSVCNKCVLKMDHHCPYVNNCVGLHNYKYFMNMVTSGTAASLLITFTMWEGVSLAWEDPNFSLNFQVVIGLVYFGNLVLSIVLSAFTFFHLYLISNGLSTIEFREKITVKFDKSPYNVGCIGNFLAVFGKNPLFWLVPIRKIYLGPNVEEPKMTFKNSEYQ